MIKLLAHPYEVWSCTVIMISTKINESD